MTDAGGHSDELRFELLGPLRVRRGEEDVDLGPRQQQAVLALLLARANDPVSPSELAAMLWPNDPPGSAANIVHRYVSKLRRLLEPGLPARSVGRWIVRRATGYSFSAETQHLDLLRFRDLTASARRCAGDPAEVLSHLVEALQLWRGPAAAGLESLLEAQPLFVALAEECLNAAVDAADAAMAAGEPRRALPAVRSAAERNPWDEHIHARLLLLLAAAGKQADAISVYQGLRRRLADDLGIDPGPQLAQVYEQVLRQDATAETMGPAPQPPPPAELPPRLPRFVGRHDATAKALRYLQKKQQQQRLPILVVQGPAGIGKTAFGNHIAHLIASRFPDGQLYAAMGPRGSEDGSLLRRFVQALSWSSAPAGSVAALTGAYRTLTSDRKLLLFFDDVRDNDELAHLLPSSPNCAVIITSRHNMTAFVAATGAAVVTLGELPVDETQQMLVSRAEGPWSRDTALVAAIADACSGLPVAIAAVAARIAGGPDFAAESIRAELIDGTKPLDLFGTGARPNDVRAALAEAYEGLSAGAARLFALWPAAPKSDLPIRLCASFAGLPLESTRILLHEMCRTGLLREQRPGRFEMSRIVHSYALECAKGDGAEKEQDEAIHRLLDHLYQTASAANRNIHSQQPTEDPAPPLPGVIPEHVDDSRTAIEWFSAELRTIVAAVRLAAANQLGGVTWKLPLAAYQYCQRDGRYDEWRELSELALEATIHAGDGLAEAFVRRCLSGAYLFLGRSADGEEELYRAGAYFEREGRTFELALVKTNLATVASSSGRLSEALSYEQAAADLFRDAGHLKGLAGAFWGMGDVSLRMGRLEEARRFCDQAMEIYERLRDPDGQGVCWLLNAVTREVKGEYREAEHCLQRAIPHFETAGSRDNLIEAHIRLGFAALAQGKRPVTRKSLEEALALLDLDKSVTQLPTTD
ncbi:BTAD domain-containing putative transcriptional regulator [Actinoplanes sp. NPDC000266]